MKTKVGVVILHPPAPSPALREAHYQNTLKCIGSLREYEGDLRIVLVDNGSSDGRLGELENVQLVPFEENQGFAKGVNAGLKILRQDHFDFYLILNNDLVFTQPLLASLLKQSSSQSSLLSPLIVNREGEVWSAGGKFNYIIARPSQLLFKPETKMLVSVDYISGCAMLIPQDIFEVVGYFDEDYFFGLEDVDYCLRARTLGFKVQVDPTVSIVHLASVASGGPRSPFSLYHFLRGNFILVRKHYLWRHRLIPYVYLFILTIKMILNCYSENSPLRSQKIEAIVNVYKEMTREFFSRN